MVVDTLVDTIISPLIDTIVSPLIDSPTNYIPPNIYDIVEDVAHNSHYIDQCMLLSEPKLTLPYRICIVGHGRSGKDTCANILGDILGYKVGGSTSYGVLPLISYNLTKNLSITSQESIYISRHANRQFWYDYCNLLRKIDPYMLLRLTLASTDFIIGTRSKEEFIHSLELFKPTTVLWMDRDVPPDPTLEYDRLFANQMCWKSGHKFISIPNNGTEADLYYLLKEYVAVGAIKGISNYGLCTSA